MPGVLIVEALAQAAGVLAVESLGLAGSGKLVYFMAIDGAKFRKPVEPGVLLRLEVEFVQKRARVCKFAGRAMIDGEVATECEFHRDDRRSAQARLSLRQGFRLRRERSLLGRALPSLLVGNQRTFKELRS